MNDKLWHPRAGSAVSQQQKKKGRRLSASFIRKLNVHDRTTTCGNFKCPKCQEFFNAGYSKFGRFSTFGNNELVCNDCAKGPGFIPA